MFIENLMCSKLVLCISFPIAQCYALRDRCCRVQLSDDHVQGGADISGRPTHGRFMRRLSGKEKEATRCVQAPGACRPCHGGAGSPRAPLPRLEDGLSMRK